MKGFMSSGVLIIGTILVATAIYMMLNYNSLEASNTEDENIYLTEAYGQNVLSIVDTSIQEQIIDDTKYSCCVLHKGISYNTLNATTFTNLTNISVDFNNPPFNATFNGSIFYGPDISCNNTAFTQNNVSIDYLVRGPETIKRYNFNLTFPVFTMNNTLQLNITVNSSLIPTKQYNFTINC
ncbi:Uncharacterised protein [uncultured archaeon]|nr:Uncharacterised protein [uncultured archaeon]